MKYIKVLIPVCIVLFTAGVFAAIPRLREQFSDKPSKAGKHIIITENDKRQKAIIRELVQVLHGMDSATVFTLTGAIDAHDLADSSNSVQTDFYYTRQGNQAYYRLGRNEMISLADAYIIVAHDAKKILLSGPKEIVNPVNMSAAMQTDFLSLEGYEVSRSQQGGLTQISLISNTHASCREYRLSFDSTGMIHHSVMRMTDPAFLLDRSKDKVLRLDIQSWDMGTVRKDLLRQDRYITIANGQPVPSERLQGYELIKD